MTSLLKMGSFAAQVFFVLALNLCVYMCAQNESSSLQISSTETSSSCIHNVTGYVCDQIENTTEVMPSARVRTDSDDINATIEIVNVESTLPTEIFYAGNETYTELSANITPIKSDIPTTQQPVNTVEPFLATTEMVREARQVSNDVCICDLNMNACDINCCCDIDCSDSDQLAFSGCHTRTPFNFDPHHCYRSHFVYHNNTELKFVQNEDGLFCIVRDNLPARFTYENRKVVTTLHEFNKLHKSHKTFSWQAQKVARPVFDPSALLRQGAIMWTVANRTLMPFSHGSSHTLTSWSLKPPFYITETYISYQILAAGLPMTVTSAFCEVRRTINYLSDWSGTCQVAINDADSCRNHQQLSASSFYKGFTFLISPQLVNETYADHLKEDCPIDICIPVCINICSKGNIKVPLLNQCIEVSDLEDPVYNSDMGNCESVVKEVRYMIYHNGTKGITEVHVYIWFTNITLYTELSQKFSVTFHWTRHGKPFHRSGNPGYIVGKPVMTGKKVTQNLGNEGEVDKEAIEVDENVENWLSIAAAKKDGRCDLERSNGNSIRQSVTFGEDRLSSCKVFVSPSNFTSPSTCAALHKAVIGLLVGTLMDNVTSPKEFNLYVATFGDSKAEETGDWVQVILETVPSFVTALSQNDDWMLVCRDIVTSVHIDIMFASVGSVALPQAKILGTVFRFGSPHDIKFVCSSWHCTHDSEGQHFDVVSSVSFVDVTKPPFTQFAEPPVYEVKLPHDFFYPFFSNSVLLRPSSTLVVALLFFRKWF